ncbi:twin-arginine translocation signal domain-containing protein [Raoultibacter phocaeensis]|uniref:twin-arginine translocation signal domain-containing protein n=1 Tax=Raoultibacter phocaeensis TaxID=2479841 RepID=UPI0015D58A97|nr:twin-arginine translocation signal domain-containing protein [Raoultibacter phocaeensis]
MEQPTTSRRTFLKVSAAVGLGGLGTAVLGSCTSGQSEPSRPAALEEISWDGAFDVVVVGFGAAGAAAAISAAESGASVLVTDKAPEGSEGGNSRYSSQLFVSAEDKDEAVAYHQALCSGYSVPEDVVDVYAEGLCALRDTLIGWGLDPSELLDVTDVTDEDISVIAANRERT